jgi:membrane protease YdiL (CAAX protease family)
MIAFLIALEYASRLTSGTPDRNVLYRYSTAVGSWISYAVLLTFVLLIANMRADLLALRRPRSWRRTLGLMILVLVVVGIATAVIDPFIHGAREQGLTPKKWEPSHAGAYAANFLVIAGFAPVVEELTFRGLGFALLRRFSGVAVAIVGVGVLFALAHGLVEAFPELAIFGCALAWLRWQTDSVYPGMLVHAAFNSFSLVAAVVR